MPVSDKNLGRWIAYMEDTWGEISLKHMVATALSPDDWADIHLGTKPLSIALARFTAGAQETCLRMAREHGEAPKDIENGFGEEIRDDFRTVIMTLYGKPRFTLQTLAGLYSKERTKFLHCDPSAMESAHEHFRNVLIARIGNFPVEFIRAENITDECRNLLAEEVLLTARIRAVNEKAIPRTPENQEYIKRIEYDLAAKSDALKKTGIVEQLPLGTVGLFSTRGQANPGTPHRSSRISRPALSVFVRSACN